MNCRKKLKLCLVLCMAIFITACNKASEQSSEMTLSSEQEYDWKEENFVSGDCLEDGLLHTADYEKIEYAEPKNTVANNEQQIANGEYFFILDTFYTSTDTIYQFQRIGAEEASEKITLSPTKWNIPNGTIMGMDVLNPEQCVFFVASHYTTETDKRQVAEHYYVIYTDYLGNELRRVDILDVLKEQEIWESKYITYIGAEINCDANGNIYIQDNEQHIIYLLNSDGKLLTSYTYQADMDNNLLQSLRTDKGELLFVCKRESEVNFICLDPLGGETKLFSGTELENVFRWYSMLGNVLYYATNEQIIGWNVTTSMMAEALKTGEYLGIEYLINNMEQFCSIYEKIGENVCIAGYPTETGQGNYIQAAGMLVVNQNAAEKEEVKVLLNYLLSMESQKMLSSGISVRRDIPKAQVMHDENNKNYYWVNADGRKSLLTKKEDGTSYLEEYQ